MNEDKYEFDRKKEELKRNVKLFIKLGKKLSKENKDQANATDGFHDLYCEDFTQALPVVGACQKDEGKKVAATNTQKNWTQRITLDFLQPDYERTRETYYFMKVWHQI